MTHPEDDDDQLFHVAIGDVLPMVKERVDRAARNRPFLEKFVSINDQSPQQALSRGANDLAAVSLLLAHFLLSLGVFTNFILYRVDNSKIWNYFYVFKLNFHTESKSNELYLVVIVSI